MWKALLARTIAGSLLLYTGVSGLIRFLQELGNSETVLQQVAGIGVLGYGVAGTVAALALLFRRRWTIRAGLAWAAAVTLTGAIAPVAFGGGALWMGLVGGLLSALVAGAVVWLARLGLEVRAPS